MIGGEREGTKKSVIMFIPKKTQGWSWELYSELDRVSLDFEHFPVQTRYTSHVFFWQPTKKADMHPGEQLWGIQCENGQV